MLAEDNLPWRQISLDETTASEAAEHRNVAAAAGAQFLPGTMLAGRYRIVALLGRGGMGEVYRADDLKLGQSVALKFLPPQLAHDATCLEYLRREVRLARQVAHPNVCRVYDLGEAEGRQCLSMEYVDGEDLAGLLRRIGHLPADKGLIVAQQIFAGLAAAHREGIVHRDLKPSNIMLDSRGHVRITDFGLACLADAAEREARWAGTPLYMAPEQLAQQPVTPRSDLYAAGLLVYELLTGQRPFAGTTPEELRRSREQTQPRRPSLLVDGVEPAVETVILQCLTADPHERPASALSVVARLPHADPLEAVLAAGETPPPELVAAACDPAALSLLWAVSCLAAVLVGLTAVVFLSASTTLVGQAHLKEPAVLAERARDVIREQGYQDAPRDEAFGFAYSGAGGSHASIHFWYRQSPARLVPTLYAGSLESPGTGSVSWDDPPAPVPGEAAVRLAPSGSLIEFRAVPVPGNPGTPQRPDHQAAGQDAEWRDRFEDLMRQAELLGERGGAAARQSLVSAPSTWTAPVSCDQQAACAIRV